VGEVTDSSTGGDRSSDRSPALEGSTSPSAATVDGRAPLAFSRRATRSRPEPTDDGAHEPSKHGHRDGAHVLLPIAIFGGIAALLGADLLSDYQAGHGPWHFLFEVGAGVLALAGVAFFARHAWEIHGVADDLERDLRASEADADRWRAEAHQALEGLGAAIDREFAKWSLTDAERSVALMLLKGMSHREIATQRGTNEGTVRQQALAIYRKAGLGGRSSLAAFFLEGLVLPERSVSSAP
jgi:DNA-binding CsgD family transcriptional regulator